MPSVDDVNNTTTTTTTTAPSIVEKPSLDTVEDHPKRRQSEEVEPKREIEAIDEDWRRQQPKDIDSVTNLRLRKFMFCSSKQ